MQHIKPDLDIQVMDDGDRHVLQRADGVRVRLFSVFVESAAGTTSHWVLAANEQAAAAQALHAACCPDDGHVKTSVKRLPLTIRGWGRQEF